MGFFDRWLGRKADEAVTRVPDWCPSFSGPQFQRFLGSVCDHLRGLGYTLELGDGVITVSRDGRTIRCGLQNLAQRCGASPERQWSGQIREHFANLMGGMEASPELEALAGDFARARELLKLRLYPEDYGGGGVELVHWPVAPGLIAALTYDLPTTIAGVPPKHAAAWPVDRDGLRAIALENLAFESVAPATAVKAGPGLEFQLIAGESFFTSSQLLRLPEVFEPLPPHGALVAVPHRHSLIVYPIVDMRVATALPTLAQITAGMNKKGPGSISPYVYWWHDSRLVHVPVSIDGKRIAVTPPLEFTELLNRLAAGRPS
jgi:hypothetical protein